MATFAGNRWFKLAELAWFIAVGITWALLPQLGWWFLPIALMPWLLRMIARRFPFMRTRFDFLLLVFLLTAVVGVWAAYDREAALAKFWLLLAGILIYYSLADQPQDNLWLIAGFIGAFGAGVAIFFLLSHDWQATPARINILQQVAAWWMEIRPNIPLGYIHQTTAGGMMALTTPFVVALGVHAWQEKNRLLGLWVVAVTSLILIGLVLTTSWGTWVASGTILGLGLLWIFSGRLAQSLKRSHSLIFVATFILGWVLLGGLVAIFLSDIVGQSERLFSQTNSASRIALAQDGFNLVGDFPYTGGGLDAFAGLYSHYIRGIPFFYYDYSHNLFLDIALEQSIFGLLAFALIYLISTWMLMRNLKTLPNSTLTLASLATLVVILIHGLVDNVVYYQWGSLLVFMIPGFVVGITQPAVIQLQSDENPQQQLQAQIKRTEWRILGITGAIVAVAIAIIVGVAYRQTLIASWYANLGSVEMARIELANFPTEQWDDGQKVALLGPVEQYFLRALDHNPNNRTAIHRLGLIAMFGRDYSTAISYLDKANKLDPNHRGILKTLGYSYVWSGELDQALPYLEDIPEAKKEMRAYIWWWQAQGRSDLADNAEIILFQLSEQSY